MRFSGAGGLMDIRGRPNLNSNFINFNRSVVLTVKNVDVKVLSGLTSSRSEACIELSSNKYGTRARLLKVDHEGYVN